MVRAGVRVRARAMVRGQAMVMAASIAYYSTTTMVMPSAASSRTLAANLPSANLRLVPEFLCF